MELGNDYTKQPEYLDEGTHSTAFQIENDGAEYVVRVPNHNIDVTESSDVAYGHILAFGKTAGRSGFERIVAADPDRGIVVSEKAKGSNLYNINADSIEKISKPQMMQFIDNLIFAVDNDIEIDSNTSNLFYDVDDGFTIIDCAWPNTDYPDTEPMSYNLQLRNMSESILSMGINGKRIEQVSDAELLKANLNALEMYRNIIVEKFANGKITNVDEALAHIEDQIDILQGLSL